MAEMTHEIAVFARAPVAGRAKRRLIPALGAAGAAELQRRMTGRMVAAAVAASSGARAGTGGDVGKVSLWCTPDCRHPSFRVLAARHPALRLRVQRGADLGERMRDAMRDMLGRRPFALLAGSDCPALGAPVLREVVGRLAGGVQAVLVPARDGGYVLIGLRRLDDSLFTDVAWGADQVLPVTRRRLAALGWEWHETTPLPDVDRPRDLSHLDPEILSGLIDKPLG